MCKKMFCLIVFIFQQSFSEKPVSSIYSDFNRSLMITPQSAGLNGADLGLNEGVLPGYSPANLTRDSLDLVSLSYANYFGNSLSTSTLAFVNHIDKRSALGIGAGYVFIPDIKDTRDIDTNENGDPRFSKPVKITNCSHIYFRAGYGVSSQKEKPVIFSTGFSLNASRIRLIDFNGYGAGLDIGSGIQFVNLGLSLTLLFENVIKSYTHWNSSYSEYGYPHLRLGIGWEKSVEYLYGRIRIGYTSPDLFCNEGINNIITDEKTDEFIIEKIDTYKLTEHPSILITSAKYGIEYKILNVVTIRGGLSQERISFGAGLSLFAQRAGIDFAYLWHELSGTYQVSLTYRW